MRDIEDKDLDEIYMEYDENYCNIEEIAEYFPYVSKEKPYITYRDIIKMFLEDKYVDSEVFDELYMVNKPGIVTYITDQLEETGRHGWACMLRIFNVMGKLYGIKYWWHDDHGYDYNDNSVLEVKVVPTVTYEVIE